MTIVALQFIFTWLAVRVPHWRHLIQGSAELLYHKGKFEVDNMRGFRIVERDLMQALRQENLDSLNEVEAIVLEDSGMVSAVKKRGQEDKSALKFVKGFGSEAESSPRRELA